MSLQKKDSVLNTIDDMKIYLNEMSLSTMAIKLDEQIKDPNVSLKSADERIIELITSEYLSRYSRRINRGMKAASLKYSSADYSTFINDSERNIDKNVLDKLMSCDFIEDKKNVIITGPCGTGKTWIASCIGVKAVEQLKSVKFYNTSKLVMELKAKEESNN